MQEDILTKGLGFRFLSPNWHHSKCCDKLVRKWFSLAGGEYAAALFL